MNNLKKGGLSRWLVAALLVFSVIGVSKAVFVQDATNVNNLAIDSVGIYDSSGTLRMSFGPQGGTSMGGYTSGTLINSDVSILAGKDLFYGAVNAQMSTTTTSGSSQGNVYTAYLTGSPNALEGSALISTSCPSGITGACVAVSLAVKDQTNVVGVAAVAASTTSVVLVYDRGWVIGLTTGTINPGDSLATSSSAAGYLESRSTGTVGVSLASGVTAGGTVKIKLK